MTWFLPDILLPFPNSNDLNSPEQLLKSLHLYLFILGFKSLNCKVLFTNRKDNGLFQKKTKPGGGGYRIFRGIKEIACGISKG